MSALQQCQYDFQASFKISRHLLWSTTILDLTDQNSKVDQDSEVGWSVKSVVMHISAADYANSVEFPRNILHKRVSEKWYQKFRTGHA